MWLLIVEAGIALGLFLFIMWWTMGPVHKRETEAATRDEAKRESGDTPSPD